MTTYLVTGGAGFIGSHIVRELVHRGENVRVVDNFLTGSRENLSDVSSDIELIEGDIRDLELMQRVMKKADYCLHQAALPSVPRSVEDPILANDININGTLNVLVAARDAGVKRFVYASSSSVYGNSPVLPKQEDMPVMPLSPYAIGKLAGEFYARSFHSLYGLPTASLRYFNVFGPGQRPDSPYAAVVPIFMAAMVKDKPPTVHGDGGQSRDFCYVDNVVSANLLACSAPAEQVAGKVFNVACGERYTINDLVRHLNEIFGTDIKPLQGPARAGDVRDSLADISHARRDLKYEPTVKFAEGLTRTVEWFRKKSTVKVE
ncbi:MAG: SDR family oxidoreductase [Candidatus Abyssobacteria bacterium SURF_17]|uniref:SDR family oxidoreductase n=1 Tax=Candidatus Abyssobacteria bacterium SURF_17 TaxID=2093361 RepID=A0A419F221_9BACT|nr:MAG: SDR family oxidoreductase [Candidatus Abyssubacteria bacterium SURF_17]